jgi:hypothetical protein
MNEKHVTRIPADILAEVKFHLETAITVLRPYVVTLTPSERHDVPKMGNKMLSFVEKSYDYAENNPSLRPPYLDMEAFSVDKSDAIHLRGLLNIAKQLEENIDDTELIAGSEAYQEALMFYNNVKLSAAQDVPGARAVYEALKPHFHKTRQNTGPKEQS